MKGRIFTLALLLLLGAALRLQAQGAEKTLVQSIHPNGHEVVLFDVTGPVEVREWSSPIVRIQTTIQIHNATETILQSLVRAGRYSTQGVNEDGIFRIFIPGLDRQVEVGGQQVQESFSYVIFAPKGVSITLPEEAAASYEP